MANRFQNILALAEKQSRSISASVSAYTAFLQTAGNNYKYSFPNQLLIHAQKTSATACATLEQWNTLGRWVNRHAKGIALLPENDRRIRYVFDIADTNSYAGNQVTRWELEYRHEETVAAMLQERFGASTATVPQLILEAAALSAAESYADYLPTLAENAPDSLLEELDEFNLSVWLKTSLASSAAYQALVRCGYEAERFLQSADFAHVMDFSTPQAMAVLGEAAHDIAGNLLREIERTIRQSARTFAKAVPNVHNEIETQIERSDEHGTDLHNAGRISTAEPDDAGAPAAREVRSAAPELSQSPPATDIHGDAAVANAERAPDGDRPNGSRDNDPTDSADGGEAGRDGETQSDRSNTLGAADERDSRSGGGNRDARADLQLTLFNPSEKANTPTEAEADPVSAFAITQEEIDLVLLHGSNMAHSKTRIYEQFKKGETAEENIAFLKREYGIGGRHPALPDTNLNEDHDSRGIRLQRGNHAELRLSWTRVEKRLRELIAQGRYLPEIEPVNIPPTALRPDERRNYRITDDALGVGAPSQRYEDNVTAIRLLKRLEADGRLATPEEQDVLSRYVGWGGLADCFDEKHSKYGELKSLLTDEEYAAARESTLTAFYTPPVVIKAIYKALENMNFRTGNILEPACGVGHFFGLLPESMGESHLFGVELDSISGRIAQQLYQTAAITVQGFEKSDLPDSFFDVAIGNVPFGDFRLADRRYDKQHFLIHDYFFAKALDKVRPGGVVAFITSKGTMDKENSAVRKYLAQRAELIGAIRLPNNTFQSAAGTVVTSDILFLQKRDRLTVVEPEWVHLGRDEDGLVMNQYFIEHPKMILGKMVMESGRFGMEATCAPYENRDLRELLHEAVQSLHAEIPAAEIDTPVADETLLPADPSVRNFSYCLVDNAVYFRENSVMHPVSVSAAAESRIRGLIELRNCVRQLIDYQTDDFPDHFITAAQQKLNTLYDAFSQKHGLINSRPNAAAFGSDSAYYLLCSLEILDEEGQFLRKADIFTKRTIKQRVVVTSVDTASEALALSLAEKARVDMPYMMQLTGKSETELANDLRGVIFLNPEHISETDGRAKYLPADEYLSGNVREKLALARRSAALYPDDYAPNVHTLEAVQPVDLTASEISVRLGATWLPPDIIEEFVFHLFQTPYYQRWSIHVRYSPYTGEWNIEGKSRDRGIQATSTYGTERINGYKIVEETLNLRDVRVFDYKLDEAGRKIPVLNKQQTAIAQGKQELIKQAFADWIWADPERRSTLCRLYNEKFNSIRPREYDGSHLNFSGINPEITLRPHQVNAIAHILYGGNTLLAHTVGAGKTFEMVAAAQESKRLGLCHKSLFVVPNHLTEQWASEYLQLYPSANILVATKKDFETRNRKRFCARIATGDYDAVIIGHSQFEKIPMSVARQEQVIRQQIDEIVEGITALRYQRGKKFSIKQLEREKKKLQTKLQKLNDQSRKDDIVTFEELGVDRLFIDEAHYYKNLAAFSKMRNVGGIAQTEAMKSSDLFMKCRYLDEITGGRGVVFATGTPISNSMVEMYTMQKYLQYGALKRNDLVHFDAWASTFGETVTAIELAPEGSGYRAKTRFAKFYNLPELMSLFKEVADIQTADMLKLPVPTASYHNIVLKPSEHQKEMVAELSRRAERVRNKMVDSSTDNMLLITNDGRKLALDQRLMNDLLPDHESSKAAACAENVYDIWLRTRAQRSTQMIFCDLSTPHGDGKFNVYDDLRDKLIAKGVPAEEIAYIHTANTEQKKKELFGRVRSGQIRVLMGSTQKMGSGTICQQKLIALHHIDCPWRPSDLQQREGRIIRQGNENPQVEIFTYVTENTFDSYLYQLVESKQRFIGQVMTSKSPVRSAEDIDETALSYAEIKALCTGNPYIKEKMDLDISVQRLRLLKASHLSQRYALEDKIIKDFPLKIAALEQRIEGFARDIAHLEANTKPNADGFSPMEIEGVTHTDKKAAGSAILAACKAMTSPDAVPLGQYRGFAMELSFDAFSREYKLALRHELSHYVPLGSDLYGNITRIDNALEALPERKHDCERQLDTVRRQLESAKEEITKPFPQEAEPSAKSARLDDLNILLNLDKPENEIVDGEPDTPQEEKEADRGLER